MHTIISYAVLIFLGIKTTHCDVLVYENTANRVSQSIGCRLMYFNLINIHLTAR
jgi:hypothetical protein